MKSLENFNFSPIPSKTMRTIIGGTATWETCSRDTTPPPSGGCYDQEMESSSDDGKTVTKSTQICC